MAPTQVREPFHREGWVFEEKLDGWRMLAYKDGSRVRLVSRNGRDLTRRFAVIATAVAKLSARSLVLDGEVAIFDERLRSRFDWLREPDPDAVATPPLLMVFDLLHQDGREFTGRPLRDRRARLEIVVAGSEFVFPARRLARNGFEAWSEVIARDYEGLVAKDEASLYEAGPTRRWLKVKQKGWTDAEDRWQRRISAVSFGASPRSRPCPRGGSACLAMCGPSSSIGFNPRASPQSSQSSSPNRRSCWAPASSVCLHENITPPHRGTQWSGARSGLQGAARRRERLLRSHGGTPGRSSRSLARCSASARRVDRTSRRGTRLGSLHSTSLHLRTVSVVEIGA